MSLDEILDILNSQLVEFENLSFNSTELIVLRGIWHNQTYDEIAKQEGYSSSYFGNVVAPELYRKLSTLTRRRVTKKNCKAILQSFVSAENQSNANILSQLETGVNISPHYPCGAVPLNSPFYLKWPSLEKQIIAEIQKTGALVRIKAPQEMGKTSLLLRILNTAKQELGYHTVSLNLQKADQNILENLNLFLRWLCVNCAHKLGLKPNLDEYWDEDLGIKMSWTIYFEEYILEQIDSPIILALDEVNEIFEHPLIANDFFPLLRSCYEEAKRIPIWQKLRLIVVHSTEIYVSLRLEQSPFNIGLPIELNGFNADQVQSLAQKYGLNWQKQEEISQLMDLVGGHPALIHLALYHLHREKISLAQLLETATSTTGIYAHHLQRHWVRLQQQPELTTAFRNVCWATEPISLDPIIAYKLNSMGLIQLEANQAMVSCRLYQKYFNSQ